MRVRRIVLLALTAVAVATGLVLFIFIQSGKPTRDGELALPGLSEPVEVLFDDYGVPHIYAQNERDAYTALGYLHAQDRLFQMEMLRRLSLGRLAEILGPKLVRIDSFFRSLRFGPTGEEMLARLPRESGAHRALEAYLAGVNHYVTTGPTPLEFHMLGIEKRPFTARDTVGVLGYMSYSFAAGFRMEPLLEHIASLGDDYLADIDYKPIKQPPRDLARSGNTPRNPGGRERIAFARDMIVLRDAIEEIAGPISLPTGSNAWVVSGERSASGKPLLASDPHIAFAQPSVWYEAHLVTPDWEMYGHHLAGVPGAVLGHNREYGWGITMFKNDDTDLYIETPAPDKPNHVLFRGESEPLIIEKEIIKVKGAADVALEVKRSRHGPIIGEVTRNALKVPYPDAPVALYWPFYHPDNNPLRTIYECNHAKSMKEFREALKHIAAPGLNFIYADATGNIGWWAAAKIPVRARGIDPYRLLDGASGRDEIKGYRPFARNPGSENPKNGIIISANHQPEAKPRVPGYYNPLHRAFAIREMLRDKETGWNADDFRRMQLDAGIEYHRPLVKIARPLLESDPELADNEASRAALAILAGWRGEHDPAAPGPAIYYRFAYEITRLAFADELGDEFLAAFQKSVWYDRTLNRVLSREESPWWDNDETPRRETRAMILKQAWLAALKNLTGRLGDDPNEWTWADVHSLTYVHSIGRRKPFDLLFNVGPFEARGGRETVNNYSFYLNDAEPYVIRAGPSTRRVIDFGAPERSTGILPTGQSGNVFDRHYDDQARMFVAGETRPQLIDRAAIEKAAGGRSLRLLPAKN